MGTDRFAWVAVINIVVQMERAGDRDGREGEEISDCKSKNREHTRRVTWHR